MISIIIPTYISFETLKIALHSVANQSLDGKEYEVIVVDNGSTSRIKEVVEHAAKKYSNLQIRYIFEPVPGLLSGRHRGALESKGDLLVYIDDDIEADKDWLMAIKEAFDDPTVQLVGGKNLPRYEIEPPEWIEGFWHESPNGRCCGSLSLLDFGDDVKEIEPTYIWGLNFSIRKSALLGLGGFHPDIFPPKLQHFQGDGETGLSIKAKEKGYKAIYQPKALVYHQIPKKRMTYEFLESRFFYQGVCNSFTYIRRKYGRYQQELTQDEKKNITDFIKRALRLIRKKTINALDSLNIYMPEDRKLKERFQEAYLKGYRFHQKAVKDNPELLKWVLKEDYWDYHLPEF